MSTIAFLFSLMLGYFIVTEARTGEPVDPEDIRFMGMIALGIFAYLGLVKWQTSSQPKFLGFSFGGWLLGFALSFLVGSIVGFFM